MTEITRTRRLTVLDKDIRQKVSKMMDAYDEATKLRQELCDAGVFVRFFPRSGVITFARVIERPLEIKEVVIEEVIKHET
jgi:hypothetical protein